MSKIITLAATALVATTGVALAHSNEARQAEQQAWIEQGRQDGSITWREGRKLRKQQAEIARVEEELSEDGRLSRTDRRVLHKLQDEAAESIDSEATDRWRRWWWLPRVGR